MPRKPKQPERERKLQTAFQQEPIATKNGVVFLEHRIANPIFICIAIMLFGILLVLLNLEKQQTNLQIGNEMMSARMDTLEKNLQFSTTWLSSKINETTSTPHMPFCYIDLANGARAFTVDGRYVSTQCDMNKTVVQP